jgi:hypothetical protein
MPPQTIEKNFEYFKKQIYESICAQYLDLSKDNTLDRFINELFAPLFTHIDSGDKLVNKAIKKGSLYRDELITVACGYLTDATKAKALKMDHLAWTYLIDAQRYIWAAKYAGQLRADMPKMEAEAAKDALKSSKSKGGQKTNEIGRLIGNKAIELMRARAMQGQTWPRVRDAVRDIKPDLWPFIKEKDPCRSEENYERSVVERLTKRTHEFSEFLKKAKM